MEEKTYIKTILPLRLEWEPCYCLDRAGNSASPATEVKVGSRVKVKFSGRYYFGVVSAIGVVPDVDEERIQAVVSVNTGLEDISPQEMELWRFIAGYYLCTPGEVYKAAYPSQKLASEELMARLSRRKEARKAREEELWNARIRRLNDRLAARDKAIEGRHNAAVLTRLQQERDKTAGELRAARERLAALGREIFPGSGKEGELLCRIIAGSPDNTLLQALKAGKPVLLKSADRNQKYIELAAEALRKGRNVLLLVPETGLARKLQESMREAFGDLLLVHHSALTQVQRRRIGDTVRSGRPYIVLGTRSSIFLPHRELGLLIVDSEQSPFYKQSDSNPRYGGRDCAVMLAAIHNAAVLLGASSPSLESTYNCQSGRYLLFEEPGGQAGSLEIVDIVAERRKNGMVGDFSRKLIAACRKEKKIALIRGYEKEDAIMRQIEELFGPDHEGFSIFSIPQAGRTELSGFDLAAMTSADALFRREDFRSDEHAFQFLDTLRRSCPKVLVQTSDSGKQVFRNSDSGSLLQERKDFSLPPYTRLADVLVPECGRFANLPSLLAKELRSKLGLMATDPLPTAGGKFRIRVTLPRDRQLPERKKVLYAFVQDFRSRHKFQGAIIFDVDPL